jgi:hypothetical protein
MIERGKFDWTAVSNVMNIEVQKAGAWGRAGDYIKAKIKERWRSMSEAPRDGTVIEIENNYGIKPWYGLFYYTDTAPQIGDPSLWPRFDSPRWVRAFCRDFYGAGPK